MMIRLTYDFWACEFSNAVMKFDLNSSSIASVRILSRHVHLTLPVMDPVTKPDN